MKNTSRNEEEEKKWEKKIVHKRVWTKEKKTREKRSSIHPNAYSIYTRTAVCVLATHSSQPHRFRYTTPKQKVKHKYIYYFRKTYVAEAPIHRHHFKDATRTYAFTYSLFLIAAIRAAYIRCAVCRFVVVFAVVVVVVFCFSFL